MSERINIAELRHDAGQLGVLCIESPEVLALVEAVEAALNVPWDAIGVPGEDRTVGTAESDAVEAIYAQLDAFTATLARFDFGEEQT